MKRHFQALRIIANTVTRGVSKIGGRRLSWHRTQSWRCGGGNGSAYNAALFQTAPIVYAAIARLAAERQSPPQIHGQRGPKIHIRARGLRQNSARALDHRFRIIEVAANPYLLPAFDDFDRSCSHVAYLLSGQNSRRQLESAQSRNTT